MITITEIKRFLRSERDPKPHRTPRPAEDVVPRKDAGSHLARGSPFGRLLRRET